MGRWEPDAPGRLAAAALDLYLERGFDDTTVAEIAARAGLTERTYYRHFADKREVLFAGAADLQALLVDAVAAASPEASPLDSVLVALDAAAAFLETRRAFARRRHAVIAANAELAERELRKLAALAGALRDVLCERGVAEPVATLTAEVGVSLFKVAFERWAVASDVVSLRQALTDAAASLRAVAAR